MRHKRRAGRALAKDRNDPFLQSKKNRLSHPVDVQWFHRRTPHVHSEREVLVLISGAYLLCPGDGDAQTVKVVSSCRGSKAQVTTFEAV